MATRTYQLKRRAEQQAETRQRIVEAVYALHGEVGPARTTITAIAERAGVERLTVYRHFPDEGALFTACSAHFRREVPLPDPAEWERREDPVDRLRAVLAAFYAYFRRGEAVLAQVTQDARRMPLLAETLAPWESYLTAVHDDLLARWAPEGRARARLSAVLRHALQFDTWRSLVRGEGEGKSALGDEDVVDLMTALSLVVVNRFTPSAPRGGLP